MAGALGAVTSPPYIGPPTEKNEADRIEWIPISEIRGMIDRREIVSSGSLVGLLYLLLDEATKGWRGTPGSGPWTRGFLVSPAGAPARRAAAAG